MADTPEVFDLVNFRWWLIVVLATAAACGGSSDDTGASPSPTTGVNATSTSLNEPALTTISPNPSTTLAASTPSTTDASSSGGEQTTLVITDAIRGYFEAYGEHGPAREAMLDNARVGSAAHAYATYWWSLFLAAGPEGTYPQDIAFEPGEAYACLAPEDESHFAGSGCITFTDFVVDSDSGLLVDFAVGGRPMSETVALGDGTTASADGVTIEVVVARQVTSDLIAVVWELSNTDDTAIEGQVRLMSATGDIVQVDAWTQNSVPPGDSILNAANISVDQLGGTLQYRITTTEFCP